MASPYPHPLQPGNTTAPGLTAAPAAVGLYDPAFEHDSCGVAFVAVLAFGNMGGTVQPETHAQHIVNLIDVGMNVQMTTDAARFTHNQTTGVLGLEQHLYDRVGGVLKRMGHNARPVTGVAVGGYQGILFTRDPRLPAPTFDRRWADEDRPVNGVYRAGSDHRKDGQAAGW